MTISHCALVAVWVPRPSAATGRSARCRTPLTAYLRSPGHLGPAIGPYCPDGKAAAGPEHCAVSGLIAYVGEAARRISVDVLELPGACARRPADEATALVARRS